MEGYIYINGSVHSMSDSTVSALDRGFHFGDGVFESMRCVDGRIIGLEDHWRRFHKGAGLLRIPMGINFQEVKDAIGVLIKSSGFDDAYIKWVLTRGEWRGQMMPVCEEASSLLIMCSVYKENTQHQQGVKACVLSVRRNETSLLMGIKSLNYLDNILGRMDAQERGFDDGLFLNTKGDLTESTACNLFCVKDHFIYTPPLEDGVLAGVTRKWILENATSASLVPVERSLVIEDLFQADEALLCNALTGIIPLICIDRHWIGEKNPGQHIRNLRKSYKRARQSMDPIHV